MSNIEFEDYIDIRTLEERVDEAIDLLEDAKNEPENSDETEIKDAEEDIEIVKNALRDLGYEVDDNSEISYAIQQVMDNRGVTFIADSYFEEAIEEQLQDFGVMPKEVHPWLTVEVDVEAAKQSFTEVMLGEHKYYFEK